MTDNATFKQPDFTSQSASIYKNAIDSSVKVMSRLAGPFACHETPSDEEVSRIETVADVAGNLGGTFFNLVAAILSSPGTQEYYVWYDVDDGSVDPTPASGLIGIEVDISANDSAAVVASNTIIAIDAIVDFRATNGNSDNHVIVTNVRSGVVDDLSDGASGGATGFTLVVIQQGTDGPSDLTIHIDAGAILNDSLLSGNNGVEEISATTLLPTAPISNPRIDRVVIDVITGIAELVGGAEAASPVVPDIPDEKSPSCQFRLETSTAVLTDSLITDERMLVLYGTNHTLESPIITDFTNMQHDHSIVSKGGSVILDDTTIFTTPGTETYRTLGLVHYSSAEVSKNTIGDIFSYTMPADTMDTNNKSIRFKAWGHRSGSTANIVFFLRIDGDLLLSMTNDNSGGAAWVVDAIIGRRSNTQCVGWALFVEATSITAANSNLDTFITGFDNDTDIALDITTINAADALLLEGVMIEILNF